MPRTDYSAFHALDPFFAVVMEGLSKFVDGEHYFDTLADDVLFEFRYDFPGWPRETRGRDNLISLYSGYGKNIRLDRGDSLIVHPSENGRVVALEYEARLLQQFDPTAVEDLKRVLRHLEQAAEVLSEAEIRQ